MSFDSTFAALALPENLTRALTDAGYENATEVQARAIPPASRWSGLAPCTPGRRWW